MRFFSRPPTTNPSEQTQPPNGGVEAWAQVVATFCICFCTVGFGNSFGAFQSFFQEDLLHSSSPSDIAWIGATQGFLLDVLAVLGGVLYDKGYMKSQLYVGGTLNLLGLIGTSFVSQYPLVFVLFGVVIGLGFGVMYVTGLAILTEYFTTKLPIATGCATAGSSIGGIVYPILFRYLVDRVGFPWTCRIFALMSGTLLLIACLLVRPRRAGNFEHESLRPSPSTRKGLRHFQMLKDMSFLAFSFSLFLVEMGVDVPFFFLPVFVQERLNLPAQIGDYLLAGLNASSLMGRLMLGFLANYYALGAWGLATLGSAILLFTWFSIMSLASIIIFVIFYGFFVGGLTSLFSPVLRTIFGDSSDIGAKLGLAESIKGVGFLIGPPIAGLLSKSAGGYLAVSLFFGGLYVVVLSIAGSFIWRLGLKSSRDTPTENHYELPVIDSLP
ncbi:MFS general substrate transporter [Xylariaceae sp. FL0662B]|nr:MFS general substrate transporter [Xylariaceae sp. FL0662B]